MESHDVGVVGGGIGGSALAMVLARNGLDVLVLERQEHYRDKVRGEAMMPWGVAEAQRLGVDEVFLGAGGCYVDTGIGYDEVLTHEEAEAAAFPLNAMVPGIPGALDVGHPESCQALAEAAASCGAEIVRGVGDLSVVGGSNPSIRYRRGDAAHEVRCRLVVGADGRASSVRRQLGIHLEESRPRTMLGGMLVSGVEAWPINQMALGTEGDVHYLLFPRPGGVCRLYLAYDIEQRSRFAGPDRQNQFLEAYRLACLPGSEAFARSTPIGPCAAYPMFDTWCSEPFTNGVVLIGDAAGFNDAIIGQGLSITLRDVRLVSDIMTNGDDWSPAAFAPYGEERAERMRRLRIIAEVVTDLRATFTEAGARRRRLFLQQMLTEPMFLAPIMAELAGPESAPPEAFHDANLDRILALT